MAAVVLGVTDYTREVQQNTELLVEWHMWGAVPCTVYCCYRRLHLETANNPDEVQRTAKHIPLPTPFVRHAKNSARVLQHTQSSSLQIRYTSTFMTQSRAERQTREQYVA